jgi:hypothetical protein
MIPSYRAGAALLVGLFLSLPGGASALPRFSVQNGAKCVLCHVNPTGGGLRNDYGVSVFERRRLAVDWPAKEKADKPARDNAFFGRLGETFSVGGDLRLAYLFVSDSEADPGDDPDLDALFLMQGDLYLAARLSEKVTLYQDIGLGGAFEIFGLVSALPLGLYVKAGAFTPPFGVKFPEHTNVNRIDLNFDPGFVDTGVEIGRAGDVLGAHLMVSAGQLGRGIALANGLLFQAKYALSGVVDYTLRTDPLKLTLSLSAGFDADQGANGRTRLVAQNTLRTTTGRIFDPADIELFQEIKVGGALGAAAGRFWYIGELDYVTNPAVPNQAGQTFLAEVPGDLLLAPQGYLSYQEVGVSVLQGLDIYGAFEFHDPDIAVAKDPENPAATDPVFRAGLFVEFFPRPNVELTALVRKNSAALAGLVPGSTDAVVMLHLFY